MNELLERILPKVQNQIIKNKAQTDVRVAFCFPDTYEIGMSNLGMRILYAVMNRMEGVWCERVFAPWGDMEDELRKNGLPLYALESGDPLADFDMIAFSVGYEMCYTNILNMLDLGNIPLRAADRKGLDLQSGAAFGLHRLFLARRGRRSDGRDRFSLSKSKAREVEQGRLPSCRQQAGRRLRAVLL